MDPNASASEPSIADLMNSVIAEVEASYEPNAGQVAVPPKGTPFKSAAQEPEPAPPEETAPQGDPGPSAVAAAAPEVPAPEKPAEDRGMERLIAREVEVSSREKAAEARLAQADAQLAALAQRMKYFSELEQRVKDAETLGRTRPGEAFRRLTGLDPDEAIQMHLAEKLGDKAPPELRQALRELRMQRQLQELQERTVQAERRSAAQQYYQRVSDETLAYVKGDQLSKHAPTAARAAKTDPAFVHREIMGEITRDATERSKQDPDGPLMSYDEAARRVEARLAVYASALTPPAAATTSAAQQAQSPASKQVPKPDSAVVAKPPTVNRPLAFWETPESVAERENAIAAAVAEAQRVNRW